MNKYTPGPWEFIGDGLFGGAYLDTKGVKCHRYQVFPFFCEDRTQGLHGMRHEADKRLIAAAPDLLQALMQLMSINPMSDYNETRDAKAVAREAIAKAIGETIKP